VALDVAGSGNALLLGGGSTVQGEIWLQNNTGVEVKIHSATLTVDVGGVPQQGPIPLPQDEPIAKQSFRRLAIGFGMEPFTAPGEYTASVELEFADGTTQTIPATLVVVANAQLAVLPEQTVFTGVSSPSTITTAAIVRNVGNVAVAVSSMPDEPLLEVGAGQRVLGVDGTGTVLVQPATDLTPLSQTLSFTLGATPTVAPAEWNKIAIDIAVPAGLTAGRHLRALPRIVNDRLSIDLLT
jgi:hypothetical protein